MTDIDRLEKLSRLREAGALTEEEFQTEKAKVLATTKRGTRSRLLTLVLVFAIIAIAAFAGFAWQTSNKPRPVALPPQAVTKAEPSIAATEAPAAVEQQTAPLDFAASTAVIGVTPAYLVKRLGTPKERHGGVLVIEVGGCTINYNVRDNQIKSFYLDISTKCQPNVQGVTITPKTNFGELAQRNSSGRYVATCLTECGNAADPIIELAFPATRATQFIGVSYWTDYRQSSGPLDIWEKSLRRRLGIGDYETPDDFDAFSCNSSPPVEIISKLRKMTVKTLYVGGDNGTTC